MLAWWDRELVLVLDEKMAVSPESDAGLLRRVKSCSIVSSSLRSGMTGTEPVSAATFDVGCTMQCDHHVRHDCDEEMQMRQSGRGEREDRDLLGVPTFFLDRVF